MKRHLSIKRHSPLYTPWYRISFLWWFVAFGDFLPFSRFGHGGWICLRLSWLRRFWNGSAGLVTSSSPAAKKFLSILLIAFLLPVLGCRVVTTPTPPAALVPGANNQFDSDTYRALATAHGFAAQAASNPAVLTESQKSLLNQFIGALNAADTLYIAYHAGTITQSDMATALAKVTSTQSAFATGATK